MRDFMVTVDQRDALLAGDESRHGLVVTLMESQDELKRQCKQVKYLRNLLLGIDRGFTAAEISEAGEIKISTVLTHEARYIFDISRPEWDHWVEVTTADCIKWDQRDGSRTLATLQKIKKLVIPKRSEYWGMGWRPTKESMEADHQATLMNVYVLRWLLFHSPGVEEGLSPEELLLKMYEDTRAGLTDLDILSEARSKALKRNTGTSSAGTPVAQYGTTASVPSAAPGATASAPATCSAPTGVPADCHVHGPIAGQEPTSDAVSLVESKAMDTRFCLNCKQHGHALVRCGVMT
eukprot:3939334-Rhodomonas_salina.1